MTSMEWAAWIQALGSAAALLVTLAIAIYLQGYARRRDKLAIIHEMWRQQQDWNLHAVGSSRHARATELMVYGGRPASQEERDDLRACMFFFLNRINHIYDAYCLKIMNETEFEAEARGTLQLLVGQKELLERLLNHRGYDYYFATKVRELVKDMAITEKVD